MNDHASLEKAQPTPYDDLLDRDSRQVPASLRRRGVTDIGPIELPTRWYTDAVIHEREVERIWQPPWQMACRVDELRNLGDTWVYEDRKSTRLNSCHYFSSLFPSSSFIYN